MTVDANPSLGTGASGSKPLSQNNDKPVPAPAPTVVGSVCQMAEGGEANGENAEARPSQISRTSSERRRQLSGYGGKLASVKANKWELFLAGELICPFCSFCTWFGLGWLFFAIFMVKMMADGGDLFSFEDAVVKSDIIVQEYYGFLAAVGTVEGCEDEDHEEQDVCDNDEACSWNSKTEKCEEKATCVEAESKPREDVLLYDKQAAWIGVIYEATEDGNLYDDDILKHVKAFEDGLLTDAGGAKSKTGASPWDEDWCMLKYANETATSGKCAAVSSFVNIFSMTSAGIEATGKLAAEGYHNSGAWSCLCSSEAGLCSVCETDGSVKDRASWPQAVTDCLAGYNTSGSTTAAPATGELPACEDASSARGLASVNAGIASYCSTLPECQWSPPTGHQFCTSSAFYHPHFITEVTTGTDKETALTKLCDETNTMWSSMRKTLVGMSSSCANKKATFGRTFFFPGSPSAQEDSDEGKNFESDYISGGDGWFASEQKLETEVESASDNKLRVMLFSSATIQTQFMSILILDSLLSLGSLFLVWAYMWWTLESCFLATCAMFEIVFSLPVTMSLWTVFFGQKILFTQMLCIYMILGIGADDAFILYDAWLQSTYAEEKPAHWTGSFAWAYRRSFSAMQVTTATTCGSFLIGATSTLPQVQQFCIFAAIVVFVDWLFCETFFASAVVLHHKYLRNERQGECCGPGCCCGLWRKVCKKCRSDRLPGEKRWLERFSEGALFDHLLKFKFLWIGFWSVAIVAMLICAVTQLRTAEESAPIGRDSLDTIRGIEIMLDEFSVGDTRIASVVWGLDEEEPINEWGSTHDDNKAKLDASTVAAVGTPAGQMEVLNLCRAADLGNDDAATRCLTSTCLVMGKATSGRCARNEEAWKKYGVYVPDDVLCTNGRYCFMEDFARYWIYHVDGASCTAETTSTGCAAATGCSWDSSLEMCYTDKTEDDYTGIPEATFISIVGSADYTAYTSTRTEVMMNYGYEFDIYNDKEMSGVKLNQEKTALSLAWVGYNATYPLQNTVEEANDWYDRWEAFHNKYTATIGGVQTSELYLFMVTQNAMVQAAVMGVALSLCISFVVLILVSWNWRVALLGLVNILGITCVFMGIIPIMGWSLGENECIFLIAVVGLSVDYTVHLLHVYNHCSKKTRVDRSREALAEMGVSVINSAVTTLLAASILFGCGFYFFLQFGAFIFLVIGFSIVMSITLLIPLLSCLGPEYDQGNLPSIRSSCKKVGAKEINGASS